MKSSIRSLAIICLSTYLSAACATNKYHDRESSSPLYQEGTGIPINDSVGIAGVNKSGNSVPTYSSGDAMHGLVEAGIALAIYPNYYRASTIRGVCKVGSEMLTAVPCRHITIELVDMKGNQIGKSDTNESGEFAFYVRKDKPYRIRIMSERYELVKGPAEALTMGAVVNLQIDREVARE